MDDLVTTEEADRLPAGILQYQNANVINWQKDLRIKLGSKFNGTIV